MEVSTSHVEDRCFNILSYMAEGCFTIITGCVFIMKGETSK